MNRRTAVLCGCAVACACGAAAFAIGQPATSDAGVRLAARGRSAGAPAALAAPTVAAADVAGSVAGMARNPARVAAWIDGASSLRGLSSLDGGWDIGADGHLHPTMALRRRFDQVLTLVGELPVEAIGAHVQRQAASDVGAATAAEVMAAWGRYVALQSETYRTGPGRGDAASLAAALAERQQARRRVLGEALAQAFFADDERQLQALIRRSADGPRDGAEEIAATSPRVDRDRLDAEATARVAAFDAAQADWHRRLADARAEAERIGAAPELSPSQRATALDRLIGERFAAADTARARALLQLPARDWRALQGS